MSLPQQQTSHVTTQAQRPRLAMILGVLLLLAGGLSGIRAQEEEKVAYYKKTLDADPFVEGVSHRQDICDRYAAYRDETVDIKDALDGLSLTVITAQSGYFRYSEELGIDPADPGIIPDILDELARRAGFSWRESFAVMDLPPPSNMTYTDMLNWAVETFDIAADWWDNTPERLAMGISFMEPWLDSSVVLIDKVEADSGASDINLLNFMKPFDTTVWFLILITIVVSAFVYQLIEYINGEKDDRSIWQWTGDNLYLSSLNFSGNFEYSPTSFGGRVFSISMAVWALVITAAYTANLASLLVEAHRPPLIIESIEHAVTLRKPICTWGGTAADVYIKNVYPNAKRHPKATELEAYEALQNGECGLFAAQHDNWFTNKGDGRYNRDCDLEWVGRSVLSIKSGFAVKTDAGHLCTSFIRDVLNVHMAEMIAEGVLEEIKNWHRQSVQEAHPLDCGATTSSEQTLEESPAGGRMLRTSTNNLASGGMREADKSHRDLKGGGSGKGGASAGGALTGGGDDASALNYNQMIGTFVLHWSFMFIAVIISTVSMIGNSSNGKREIKDAADGNPPISDNGLNSPKSNQQPVFHSALDLAFQIHEQILGREKTGGGATTSCSSDDPSISSRGGGGGGGGSFDWEARYAQMTAQERDIVDILFKRKGRMQMDG